MALQPELWKRAGHPHGPGVGLGEAQHGGNAKPDREVSEARFWTIVARLLFASRPLLDYGHQSGALRTASNATFIASLSPMDSIRGNNAQMSLAKSDLLSLSKFFFTSLHIS